MFEIFTHVADTHLRDSQYGRLSRGEDFLKALLSAIEVTQQRGLKLMLHGGDFFNATAPAPEVVAQLLTVNEALHKAGITMLVVSGNHERTAAASDNNWLDVMQRLVLQTQGKNWNIICIDHQVWKCPTTGLTVCGYPSCGTDELRQFLTADSGPRADVLLWHGMVREFCEFPVLDAITVQDFANCTRFKSVLLGDIHVHKYFALRDNGIIGYPGSTEICAVNEEIEKGIGLIYWDRKETFRVAKLPIKTRPVLPLRVADEVNLAEALDQIAKTRDQAPMIFLRYNPTLTGAMSRVFSAMHPDSIVRPAKMTEAIAPAVDPKVALAGTAPVRDQAHEVKSVGHFLGVYVPAGSDLFRVAEQCMDSNNKAIQLLTDYVDRVINPTSCVPSESAS